MGDHEQLPATVLSKRALVSRIIKNFLKELDKFLNEETLNENEIKLGHALYDLFNDY